MNINGALFTYGSRSFGFTPRALPCLHGSIYRNYAISLTTTQCC